MVKRTEHDDSRVQEDVRPLKKPRPGLQGVTFAPTQHESDRLDTRGPEIDDQSDVGYICRVAQVSALGMISSFPRIKVHH